MGIGEISLRLKPLIDEACNLLLTIHGQNYFISMFDDSLMALERKRKEYSGAGYLDQIEKNVIYLGECGRVYDTCMAQFLCTGEPFISDQGFTTYDLQYLRLMGKDVAESQWNYLRNGCKECKWHHLHSNYSKLKEMRNSSKIGDYIEELEFCYILNQYEFGFSRQMLATINSNNLFRKLLKIFPIEEIILEIQGIMHEQSHTLSCTLAAQDNTIGNPQFGKNFYKAASESKITWHDMWGNRLAKVGYLNEHCKAAFCTNQLVARCGGCTSVCCDIHHDVYVVNKPILKTYFLCPACDRPFNALYAEEQGLRFTDFMNKNFKNSNYPDLSYQPLPYAKDENGLFYY